MVVLLLSARHCQQFRAWGSMTTVITGFWIKQSRHQWRLLLISIRKDGV